MTEKLYIKQETVDLLYEEIDMLEDSLKYLYPQEISYSNVQQKITEKYALARAIEVRLERIKTKNF